MKRLHSGRAEDDARRFAREARLGATLNHPNVVTVFDALSDGDTVLIVMEYVSGTDLEAMLDSGPLGDDEVLRILDQVAAAIDHAHQNGIVHRDVKPSNVLIRDDGVVKLADLGIARALEDTAITRSGIVLGSLPYIAPEALRGEDIGPEADVHSVALIAFEALTGRKARREGTVPEVTHQAVNEPPPDLRAERSDLPQGAADLVAQALDPEPSKRPRSAGAFVRDLREALSDTAPAPSATVPIAVETTAARPAPTPEPEAQVAEPPPPPRSWEPPVKDTQPDGRRRWVLPLIGGALAVGAIVVFAVLVLGGGSGGSNSNGGGAKAAESPSGSGGGSASTSGESSAASATAAASSSPDGAVQAFYERAAAGDYRGAWDLADSSFRSQLGGFPAFQSQQSTLRSIEFPSLDVTSDSGSTATVSFSTVADHSSFVDHCTGSMSLAKAAPAGSSTRRRTSAATGPRGRTARLGGLRQAARGDGGDRHAQRRDLARQVEAQPAQEAARLRREDHLVVGAEVEGVPHGRERVVAADDADHRAARGHAHHGKRRVEGRLGLPAAVVLRVYDAVEAVGDCGNEKREVGRRLDCAVGDRGEQGSVEDGVIGDDEDAGGLGGGGHGVLLTGCAPFGRPDYSPAARRVHGL